MFLNRLFRVMGAVVKLFPIGNLTLSIQGSVMISMGIRTFEILVLRPIFVLLLLATVAFIIKGMWFLLGGSILGLFYIGTIGSKLHPLQSAADLSQGPLKSEAARIEDRLISPEDQRLLVGHACTRVGLLVGISVGVILWTFAGWSWYVAGPFAFITTLLFGAILKVSFKT